MKIFADASHESPAAVVGGAERRVLAYGGALMLAEFRFPAGVTLPEHSHVHEQIGYVVSGEVDFMIEGQEPARLGPGGSYYVPSNLKHHVYFRTEAVLIDCFTPQREDFLEA